MIRGHLLQIETPQLFESHHRKAGIQGVKLPDLNIGAILISRIVGRRREVLVTHLLPLLRGVIGRPQHATQSPVPALEAHAYVDEGNLLGEKKVEDADAGRAFIDAYEGEGDSLHVVD